MAATTTTATTGKLDAQLRTGHGKTYTRKLRAEGRVPAVCYGLGKDPVSLAVDPKALLRALDAEKRANTVITLTVGGDGKGKPEALTVMLRDWQTDALTGAITHADFVRVDLSKETHATVPVVITGKAEGVKLGGILHVVYRSIEVASTPDKIPTKIEVNVDKLGMGDSIHVKDLQLPAGVRPLLEQTSTICVVTAPKAEKVEAAAEGAAPAEGAAAPAAAPAAGAAAAPAAKAEEKKGGGEKKEKK